MGYMTETTAEEGWAMVLQQHLDPLWTSVVNGTWAQAVAGRQLGLDEMRGWMLHLYPLIHALPGFLAQSLTKARENDYARTFLINNIRVEQAHAHHWLAMAEGFGLEPGTLLALTDGRGGLLPEVATLNRWLSHVNTEGSLAEAVSATAFVLEGLISDLARKTINGFLTYASEPGVAMTRASSRWIREKALYDEDQPATALLVVSHAAICEEERRKTLLAASRSVELFGLALDASFRFPAPTGLVKNTPEARDDHSSQPVAKPHRLPSLGVARAQAPADALKFAQA